MGKERHGLALVGSNPSAAIENGKPPASMSFGPGGYGAGWYDERQQIFHAASAALSTGPPSRRSRADSESEGTCRAHTRTGTYILRTTCFYSMFYSPSHRYTTYLPPQWQRTEMTRDGENEVPQSPSLVETHCSSAGGTSGGTRANALNVAIYYVNGPMIMGYIQPNTRTFAGVASASGCRLSRAATPGLTAHTLTGLAAKHSRAVLLL
jgi:hypothetical protein